MAELQGWIGRLRYGDGYDADNQVVRLDETRDRLRDGIAEIGPKELEDPNIRHFAELNKNHRQGDELLCLAKIRLSDPPRIMGKLALQKLGIIKRGRR